MLHCAYRKKITAGKPQHTNFYSPPTIAMGQLTSTLWIGAPSMHQHDHFIGMGDIQILAQKLAGKIGIDMARVKQRNTIA